MQVHVYTMPICKLISLLTICLGHAVAYLIEAYATSRKVADCTTALFIVKNVRS
jgi:hypothetical protein